MVVGCSPLLVVSVRLIEPMVCCHGSPPTDPWLDPVCGVGTAKSVLLSWVPATVESTSFE